MQKLFRWLVVLGSLILSFVPAPEFILSLYFLVPSSWFWLVALFVSAVCVTTGQMMCQYWAAPEVAEQVVPGIARSLWQGLTRQDWFKKIEQHPPSLFLVTGFLPIRIVGVGFWRSTRYRWAGYFMALGTCVQLGLIFRGIIATKNLVAGHVR